MTARDFERLARHYLLPSLPDFEIRGRLLYRPADTGIIHAFYGDATAHAADDFYLHAFPQALYVLRDDVEFTYGLSLGRWSLQDPETDELMHKVLRRVGDAGLPFLDRVRTPRDFALHVASVAGEHPTPYDCEQAAVSLAVAGDYDGARRWIARLESLAALEDDEDWIRDVVGRALRLSAAIARGQAEVTALCDEWVKQTSEALGLSSCQSAQ